MTAKGWIKTYISIISLLFQAEAYNIHKH